MAKKFVSTADLYKSKSRDGKRRGADIFHATGQLLKKMPLGRRKKGKKHSWLSKKSYSTSIRKKNSTTKKVTQNQVQEPMSFGEVLISIGVLLSIAVMCILFFAIGFWKTMLLMVGLYIAIGVIFVAIDGVKDKGNIEEAESLCDENEDRSNQIPYIKSLFGELKKHQDIANTSNDPDEVKKHLDCLLEVIDEIMTFDEALLKQAGMTKANAVSVKEDILKVYDTMIAQAWEQ